MKIYKSSKLALAAILSVGMLAACSDDDDINVVGAEGSGAYVAPTFSTNVTLDENATSFDVPFIRSNASGELTINIAATSTDGAFNVPTTLTFANGESEANLHIGYLAESLVFDKDYTIQLSVTEGAYNYADASTTIYATLPGHWTAWAAAPYNGYGDFTYGLYMTGDDPNLPVSYRISNDDPNIEQYRIEHWFYDQPLYIELDKSTNTCTVPMAYTGYDTEKYGPLYTADAYTYALLRKYDDAEDYKGTSTYDPETGLFSLNLAYFVKTTTGYGHFVFDEGYEYFQLQGFADYNIDITRRGNYLYKGVEYAVTYIYKGATLTSLKYYATAGALTDEEVEAKISELEADSEAQSMTESGIISLPMEGNGPYTVVAVGYDGKEVKSTVSKTLNFVSAQSDNPWRSKGWVKYTDGYVAPLFGLDIVSYYVPVQENSEVPGFYRLVDAYGDYFPYNSPGDYDSSDVSYLYVDASDPEGVYVDYSESTTNYGYGDMAFWSLAGYYMEMGYDLEDVKAQGLCGVIEGNKIQFPQGTLALVMGEDIYPANYWPEEEGEEGEEVETPYYGPFCIDLSTLTSTRPAAQAPAKKAGLKAHKPVLKSSLRIKNMKVPRCAARILDQKTYLNSTLKFTN